MGFSRIKSVAPVEDKGSPGGLEFGIKKRENSRGWKEKILENSRGLSKVLMELQGVKLSENHGPFLE